MKSQQEHPLLLTARELAVLLRISARQVWRLARDDRSFPKPVRLGRRITRFRRGEVVAFIDARSTTNLHCEGSHG